MTHLAFARLELRFHENDEIRPVLGRFIELSGHCAQRDEGEIGDDDRIRPVEFGDIDQAEVGPLQWHDSRVVAKALVELSPPDVESGHRSRTPLQGHLGEPAGRSPDVENCFAGRVDREGVEGGEQFERPARHPLSVVTYQRDRGVDGDERSRFRGGHTAYQDLRLRDEPLCLGAGTGELASDDLGVETPSGQDGSDSSRSEPRRLASSAAGSGKSAGSSSSRRASAASSFSTCSWVISIFGLSPN